MKIKRYQKKKKKIINKIITNIKQKSCPSMNKREQNSQKSIVHEFGNNKTER
jgi:hypothetical protein